MRLPQKKIYYLETINEINRKTTDLKLLPQKYLIQKINRQAISYKLGKLLAKHISSKGQVCKIYKELLQVNYKMPSHIINGQNI